MVADGNVDDNVDAKLCGWKPAEGPVAVSKKIFYEPTTHTENMKAR